MSLAVVACPNCGLAVTRKNGRDRQGRQFHQCLGCCRRFTALTATPFSGYRFPPDIIAIAVRWYLRYRLSYADVAELLAERGCVGYFGYPRSAWCCRVVCAGRCGR